MIGYVEQFLWAMRGVSSRKATWVWFVVVFVGFVVRGETFGVSSIVRALAFSSPPMPSSPLPPPRH